MYTQFFNLEEPPFSIAPNPRYLFLTAKHREALAHLLYGLGRGGGFVALTGEVGTGKTTLCRCLLEQLPSDVDIALIFNPRLDSPELVAAVCDELRIPHADAGDSLRLLVERLNHHLLDAHAKGRRTVLLIDEAQNLSHEVLEQIRLLTNLETNQTKLLQIILVGQPELNVVLSQPGLRQLSQRITARYHLEHLNRDETADYIRHRLSIAGVQRPLFSRMAIGLIHRISGGIPRVINILCDRSLLGAYSLGKHSVNRSLVKNSATELHLGSHAWFGRVLLGMALIAILGAGLLGFRKYEQKIMESGLINFDRGRENLSKGDTKAVTPGPDVKVGHEEFAKVMTYTAFNKNEAMTSLLGLWKVPSGDGRLSTCGSIEADWFSGRSLNGLRCLSTHSTWMQLQAMNLPVILEVVTRQGEKRYLPVAGFALGKLTLASGGDLYHFDLQEVLSYWTGNAEVIWRPVFPNFRPLKSGESSEVVNWLRQRMGDDAASVNTEIYDAGLREKVMDFQLKNGLAADGVVGTATMIMLGSEDKDGNIPRLRPFSH